MGEGAEALSPEAIVKRAERVLFISEAIAAKAESNDDARLALAAVDRCQRALESLMKVTGLIGAEVQVNIDNRQQNLYQNWPLESLTALQDFHRALERGETVQDAVRAILGHKEAPMLITSGPSGTEAA